MTVKMLHHAAYRCKDSEATRAFYEDFLGLKLVNALPIAKGDEPPFAIHTFFALADGSCIAFFEVPGKPFEFVNQDDFDLHLALETTEEFMLSMQAKAKALGMEARGVADHDIVKSVYFRDPNGYVVELCHKTEKHDELMDPKKNNARSQLNKWQEFKELDNRKRESNW